MGNAELGRRATGREGRCLALAAAEALRVPMPLASLVHDRLQTLIARGGRCRSHHVVHGGSLLVPRHGDLCRIKRL
jgi:hypothetical protein